MRNIIVRRWQGAALAISIIVLPAMCLGLVQIMGEGTWPADWPKEMEAYRGQAKTIWVMTGTQEGVFEISFRSRDEFEKIWPVVLKLKSQGAPLMLISAGSGPGWAGLFDNNQPLLRIYAPSYASRHADMPGHRNLKPSPPWPDSAKLPNGQLPEYVVESDDRTTWVPAGGNYGAHKGFMFRASIEIELVVDGNIIDLNRIRLPADTPIIDKRTFANAADANGV